MVSTIIWARQPMLQLFKAWHTVHVLPAVTALQPSFDICGWPGCYPLLMSSRVYTRAVPTLNPIILQTLVQQDSSHRRKIWPRHGGYQTHAIHPNPKHLNTRPINISQHMMHTTGSCMHAIHKGYYNKEIFFLYHTTPCYTCTLCTTQMYTLVAAVKAHPSDCQSTQHKLSMAACMV